MARSSDLPSHVAWTVARLYPQPAIRSPGRRPEAPTDRTAPRCSQPLRLHEPERSHRAGGSRSGRSSPPAGGSSCHSPNVGSPSAGDLNGAASVIQSSTACVSPKSSCLGGSPKTGWTVARPRSMWVTTRFMATQRQLRDEVVPFLTRTKALREFEAKAAGRPQPLVGERIPGMTAVTAEWRNGYCNAAATRGTSWASQIRLMATVRILISADAGP